MVVNATYAVVGVYVLADTYDKGMKASKARSYIVHSFVRVGINHNYKIFSKCTPLQLRNDFRSQRKPSIHSYGRLLQVYFFLP